MARIVLVTSVVLSSLLLAWDAAISTSRGDEYTTTTWTQHGHNNNNKDHRSQNLDQLARWLLDRAPQCSSSSNPAHHAAAASPVVVSIDPFPPSFDESLYGEIYGRGKDYSHYVTIGQHDGYECSHGQRLREHLQSEIVEPLQEEARREQWRLLEIGPFLNPMLVSTTTTRNNNEDDDDPLIRYLDVLDLPGLQQRAAQVGYPVGPHVPPQIHYVHPYGDIRAAIPHPEYRSFAMALCSHCLPNQIDLVGHLQAIGEDVLVEGGYYVVWVADMRFMFDKYLPETNIATVLNDHYYYTAPNSSSSSSTTSSTAGGGDTPLLSVRNATHHRLKSLVEHRALTTTTTTTTTQQQQQQRPEAQSLDVLADRLQQAVAEYYQKSDTGDLHYIDVHNYHFTPTGLAFIVSVLYELGLTQLRVHRLYPTLHGSTEFGLVLKKCSK